MDTSYHHSSGYGEDEHEYYGNQGNNSFNWNNTRRRGGGKWIKQERDYSNHRWSREEPRFKQERPFYNQRNWDNSYQNIEADQPRRWTEPRARMKREYVNHYNGYQEENDHYGSALQRSNLQNRNYSYRAKQENNNHNYRRDFSSDRRVTYSKKEGPDNAENETYRNERERNSGLNTYPALECNPSQRGRNNVHLENETKEKASASNSDGYQESCSKDEMDMIPKNKVLEEELSKSKLEREELQESLEYERRKNRDCNNLLEEEKAYATAQYNNYTRTSSRLRIAEEKVFWFTDQVEDLEYKLDDKERQLREMDETDRQLRELKVDLDVAQRKSRERSNAYTFSQIMDDLKHITSERPSNLSCTICKEPYIAPMTLNCQHTFCKYCIQKWRVPQTDETCNDKCPNCKLTITSQKCDRDLEELIDTWIQAKCKATYFNERLEEIVRRNEECTASTASTQDDDIEEIQLDSVSLTNGTLNHDSPPLHDPPMTHTPSIPPISSTRERHHQEWSLASTSGPSISSSMIIDNDLEVIEVVQAPQGLPKVRKNRQFIGTISDRLMMMSGTVQQPQISSAIDVSEYNISIVEQDTVVESITNQHIPTTNQTNNENDSDIGDIIQIIDELDYEDEVITL